MPDALSKYAAKKLLDHVLGTAKFEMPEQVYLAAYTSDPTDADTGTEVSKAAESLYVRVAVDFGPANEATGEAEAILDVEFPEAGKDWGDVSHVGLRDAAAAGKLLLHGPLLDPDTGEPKAKTIETGDTLRLTAAELVAAFD